MTALRKLAHIAVDATLAGQDTLKTAIQIAPSVEPALKQGANSSQPYLNQSSYGALTDLLATITPLVHDMTNQAQGLSLSSLPLSASQSKMISTLLPWLPVADTVLSQVPTYKSVLGWLIGIGQSRSFLVEPMDSAELRTTGGFTGQFGVLTFNGGRMAPLSLKNIGAYEEDHSGLPGGTKPIDAAVYARVVGQVAPSPYSSWWPIANFGVRDANVSADFPTSAKIIINRYAYEFQQQVDGVISFTPTLIEQVLRVTGPITIASYHETITAQNLEDKLHYYQLNNAGIYKEQTIEHVQDPEIARKLFTQRVTKQLMSAVFHLPASKLLPMANQMLQATKTKDLQIYFDNPQLESLLAKYGSNGVAGSFEYARRSVCGAGQSECQ